MTLESLTERLHYGVLFWSTVAAIATAAVGWWLGRRLKKIPDTRQAATELLMDQISGVCTKAFGEGSRLCVSVFGTLVLLSLVCNVLGLAPLTGLTLGIMPDGGLEISGEQYVDFNDDRLWQPGEPVVRNGLADWKSPRTDRGFLLPSAVDPTSGANILLELSLAYALVALAMVWLPTLGRSMKDNAGRDRWYALPVLLVWRGIKTLGWAASIISTPLGGAMMAIVVGVVLYNVLLVSGIVFMTDIGVGLFEAVVIAVVLSRRRKVVDALPQAAAGAT